jgi:hypothetical protein
MAKRSLERSKFGRLLADYIEIHNANPAVLRKADTIDLVRGLEMFVGILELLLATLAAQAQEVATNVLRGAQKGDRRALVGYLKNPKNPITPDIRAHIIEILSGKRRSANRPPASATAQRHRAIALFVAARVFSGESYAKAKRGAQEEFRCSNKLVENACDKHGEVVAQMMKAATFIAKIQPISDEILRRGEPEHCERAQELLDRCAVVTDELAEFVDENDKAEYRKITAPFLS